MVSFNPIGDTLNSVGVLGQAFTACVRGFGVWQKGEALAEEAIIIQVKLEIQGARFKAWGCGWGIERNAHLQHPKFRKYGEVAVNCINLIRCQINSLEALDSEFPVLKLAARRPRELVPFEILSGLADPHLRQDFEEFRHRKTVTTIENSVTAQAKWKWGWEDGTAFKKLAILESLIDGLYQLLPPPHDDPMAMVALNSSMASTDVRTLDAIGNEMNESSLQSSIAWLKSMILKLQDRSITLQDKEVMRKWHHISETRDDDKRNSRAIGTLHDSDVLIEWKTIDSGPSHAKFLLLDRRIKDVARLLQSDLKPEELRTLSCVGVVEKVDEQQTKYGLLYSLPSPSTSFTLRDVIARRKDLLLGDYFNIAQVLSKALLCLHLSGWLHKGIRSDNVLFFAKAIANVLPACPYIVGFEYSRVDEQNALTEELADDIDFNLYRHPDSQGLPVFSIENYDSSNEASAETRPKQPYRREFDIYSLGVILLEIGLRKTVQTIFGQALNTDAYGKHSPPKFRSWLIDAIAPQLGPKMGKLYQDATILCLRGNFDTTNRTLEAAFYIDVVKNLERCQA